MLYGYNQQLEALLSKEVFQLPIFAETQVGKVLKTYAKGTPGNAGNNQSVS